MHLLVDSCVSLLVYKKLKKDGYSVEWVPYVYNGDPGDEEIIDKALGDGSVLITGDKDFGEWIFLRGKSQPPLIRLAAMGPKNQEEVVMEIIEKYTEWLKKGALITADKKRIRIREKG